MADVWGSRQAGSNPESRAWINGGGKMGYVKRYRGKKKKMDVYYEGEKWMLAGGSLYGKKKKRRAM